MSIRHLRTVFFGITGTYSPNPLRAIHQNTTLVGLVETVPKKIIPANPTAYRSPLRRFAEKNKIPYHLFINNARPTDFLRSLRPDAFCVAGMARLLKPQELQIPPLGTINLHPSLLPKFRGPQPTFWQAHAFDLQGGLTVHLIDEGTDTGDILLQKTFPIQPGDTQKTIVHTATTLGAAAMLEALQQLHTKTTAPIPQRHLPCPFYARQLTIADLTPDWQNWSLEHAWHFLRATYTEYRTLPQPPDLPGHWRIDFIDKSPPDLTPGTISQDARGHFVSHHAGKIRLTLISPRGPLRRLAHFLKRKLRTQF